MQSVKTATPFTNKFWGGGGEVMCLILKKKKKGIYGRPVYERKPNVLQRKTLALMS